MAGKNLDITPVFNHKKSIALVDTAEELVDRLDNLSVCLKHIEERHVTDTDHEKTGDTKLYETLKENLDVARDLTDTLKREKWRLSRRQMSIELRMGELEEYKTHLKRDMTDMNQTVESLSMRLIQLEEALVDAEEKQEQTEAERVVAERRAQHSEELLKEMEHKQEKLLEEIRKLKSQRTDNQVRRQNSELQDEVEILMIENKRLKELIRENEDAELPTKDVKERVPNLPTNSDERDSDSTNNDLDKSDAITKTMTQNLT